MASASLPAGELFAGFPDFLLVITCDIVPSPEMLCGCCLFTL
jgi:hypothetical protein